MRSRPSEQAVASCVPSGLNATALTLCGWGKLRVGESDASLHDRTLLSALAEKNTLPAAGADGNATSITSSARACTCSGFPNSTGIGLTRSSSTVQLTNQPSPHTRTTDKL